MFKRLAATVPGGALTLVKMHPAQLAISRTVWISMQGHMEGLFPQEACGLLAGRNRYAELMIPVTNELGSSVRFRMEPLELLNALEHIDSLGLEMLAIFHSHPKGPETPSPSDIAEAEYPVVNIIWSPVNQEWQARGFWIENGDFEATTHNSYGF